MTKLNENICAQIERAAQLLRAVAAKGKTPKQVGRGGVPNRPELQESVERFGQIALVFRNSLDDLARSTGQVIEKAIDLSRHNGTPFLLDQVICPTPGRSAPFYDDSSCGMTAIKRTTWGDATLWIVAIGTFSRPRPRAARE